MSIVDEKLTAVTRLAIKSLDPTGAFKADHGEALALCAQRLSLAARGTVALHLFREDGLWHVESWRDGVMVESYVGVATLAEALNRIGEWMRSA